MLAVRKPGVRFKSGGGGGLFRFHWMPQLLLFLVCVHVTWCWGHEGYSQEDGCHPWDPLNSSDSHGYPTHSCPSFSRNGLNP